MKQIESIDGVMFTQNIDNLPIEERVFFRAAIGMNADDEHFRPATTEELGAWAAWKEERDKELML
jgi:hypothetical protein